MTVHPEIIADVARARSLRGSTPLVLGICGSQGSGKSTLTEALAKELRDEHRLSVAALSLDDLYLPSKERARLAEEVHSLLRTRGVPGTHDVDLGIRTIRNLLSAQPDDTTCIPRFDKALDEPCATKDWQAFRGRADVVIFEGWCVGAVAQAPAALIQPLNELERNHDADGVWRRYVNSQLEGPYRSLFGLIDRLLMLRAPGFDVVFEWRREQERALAASLGPAGVAGSKVMNDGELLRFIAHYERLTRHILSEMPGRAAVVAELDRQRRIVAIQRR